MKKVVSIIAGSLLAFGAAATPAIAQDNDRGGRGDRGGNSDRYRGDRDDRGNDRGDRRDNRRRDRGDRWDDRWDWNRGDRRCNVELDRTLGDRDKFDVEIDSNRRNGQAFVVVNYDRGADVRGTVNLNNRGDFVAEGITAPDRARRVVVTAWILGSRNVTRCSDTLAFGGRGGFDRFGR